MDARIESVAARAPIGGTSLHRWLVGIPMLLYLASVALFALYAYDLDVDWLREGFVANALAVIAGLVAAVPGALDFVRIPRGEARAIARRHASLMLVVLAIFALNVALDLDLATSAMKGAVIVPPGFDSTMPLAITATGLTLALFGGALGMTLAHHFHVGETKESER